MICQFSVKNFGSYRSEVVFDFQAANLPEFRNTLLTGQNDNLFLPICVIYGPNGGGKTTLIEAMGCLISTVVKPIYDLKKFRITPIVQHETACVPYLLDEDSRTRPTEFQVFFQVQDIQYCYNLSVKEDIVMEESLYWKSPGGKKPGMLFERQGNEIQLGAKLKGASINRSVNPKMPYLTFLAINYNIPMISEVQEWFESCIIRNYANVRVEQQLQIIDDEKLKDFLIRALNDMGIDITGYRLDENQNLYTQRNIDGKVFELEFIRESAGTRKLFSILPILIIALQQGRLLLLDELDAKLHPKLLQYVISLFKNPQINTEKAQLVFTSHDMTTMKNTVFRRDEIWFAAINNQHESELYSLYDIKNEDGECVRTTAAYNKQYLEGRYGADPYLRAILDWRE